MAATKTSVKTQTVLQHKTTLKLSIDTKSGLTAEVNQSVVRERTITHETQQPLSEVLLRASYMQQSENMGITLPEADLRQLEAMLPEGQSLDDPMNTKIETISTVEVDSLGIPSLAADVTVRIPILDNEHSAPYHKTTLGNTISDIAPNLVSNSIDREVDKLLSKHSATAGKSIRLVHTYSGNYAHGNGNAEIGFRKDLPSISGGYTREERFSVQDSNGNELIKVNLSCKIAGKYNGAPSAFIGCEASLIDEQPISNEDTPEVAPGFSQDDLDEIQHIAEQLRHEVQGKALLESLGGESSTSTNSGTTGLTVGEVSDILTSDTSSPMTPYQSDALGPLGYTTSSTQHMTAQQQISRLNSMMTMQRISALEGIFRPGYSSYTPPTSSGYAFNRIHREGISAYGAGGLLNNFGAATTSFASSAYPASPFAGFAGGSGIERNMPGSSATSSDFCRDNPDHDKCKVSGGW